MNTSKQLNKTITLSALITIVGLLFSGPIGVSITSLIKAQPTWESVDVFIKSYHPIQGLPFVFGFIMLLGFVMFISAATGLADSPLEKIYSKMAIIFAAVYAVIIGANYTIQVAYVPIIMHLNKDLTEIMTMANPLSISWIFEMFGYAFLGLSAWLLAPLFKGSHRMRYIRYLLIINGILSVIGAIITAINISWVLTPLGLISYVIWNLLIVILMILIFLEFRPPSTMSS